MTVAATGPGLARAGSLLAGLLAPSAAAAQTAPHAQAQPQVVGDLVDVSEEFETNGELQQLELHAGPQGYALASDPLRGSVRWRIQYARPKPNGKSGS